jgi:hypothetical protein
MTEPIRETRPLTADELRWLAVYEAQRDAVLRMRCGRAPLSKAELAEFVDNAIAKFSSKLFDANLKVPPVSPETLEKVYATLEKLGEVQGWLDRNTQ